VHREDALDADAVRHLAYREGLAGPRAGAADHGPFEDLDAFLVAFGHAHVHANGVTGTELRDVLTSLLGLYAVDRVHAKGPSLSGRREVGQA
jgi:hypothetical protein